MQLQARDADEAANLAGQIFVRLLWGLLVVSILLSLSSSFIVPALAQGASEGLQALAGQYFHWLAFVCLANSLIDYFALVMNAHHRFLAAAAGPAINTVISGGVLVFAADYGGAALICGLLLGLCAQLLFVVLVSQRIPVNIRWVMLPRANTHLNSVYRLIAPVLLGIVLTNLTVSILQFLAAASGDGGVASFGYANRLHNVFQQILVMGVSTVLLASFSQLAAEQKIDELRTLLRSVFRLTLCCCLAVFLFVLFFGPVLVSLLFERGAFDAAAGDEVTRIWFVLICGLFPIAWGIFLSRLFQAMQRPWFIARLALMSFVANLILMFSLFQLFGLLGVVVGHVVAYAIVAIGHQYYVRELVPHALGVRDIGFLVGVFGLVPIAWLIERAATAWFDLSIALGNVIMGLAFVLIVAAVGWWSGQLSFLYRRWHQNIGAR